MSGDELSLKLSVAEMKFLESFLDTASPWGETDEDHDIREKIYLKISILNLRHSQRDFTND